MQGYLKAVGINAKVTVLQVGAVVQRSLAGQNPMELGSWGSYSVNDVSAILPNFFTCTGNDYTRDPEMKKLVEAGGATVDPDQRRKAYSAAIKLITEKASLDADLHPHGGLWLFEAAQLQALSGRTAALLPQRAGSSGTADQWAGDRCDRKDAPSRRAEQHGHKRRVRSRGGRAGIAAAALAPAAALAQQPTAATGTPPSVITNPPRQWGRHAPPDIYPDPDVIVIDPSFNALRIGNTAIHRVATGFIWAEGPAWSSEGQYFVFSDVVGNTQYRLLWDDRRVTPFRKPSNNSNGNSFDFQGRQLSTEDFNRRVVRWEHDGTMTVIADQFDGKPLNSPNDLVPHPDGSIWFTDPPYRRPPRGRPSGRGGRPDQSAGSAQPAHRRAERRRDRRQEAGTAECGVSLGPERPARQVITEDQLKDPNGICFSPDYKTLYVVSTGRGPGDSHSGGTRTIHAFDVQGTKVANGREFLDMTVDGVKCGPDGMRADVAGNLWCSANAPLGYAGVLSTTPQGKLIGRIRLPEVCANLCFGGPKRNQLFMTASQSIYMLQVQTQGAAPG